MTQDERDQKVRQLYKCIQHINDACTMNPDPAFGERMLAEARGVLHQIRVLEGTLKLLGDPVTQG